MSPKFQIFGDHAILVSWSAEISADVHKKVLALDSLIRNKFHYDIIETVISFHSIAVYLRSTTSTDLFMEKISVLEVDDWDQEQGKTFEIPVCYETDFGPDLEDVAAANNLSVTEVIKIHSAPVYTVQFIGFLPGFPYLSGLDKRLQMLRRPTPRTMVQKGSVGIGGSQTGIYTMDSPGGWHIIGNCPLEFFRPDMEFPVLFNPGDRIRFKAISTDTLREIKEQLAKSDYELKSTGND